MKFYNMLAKTFIIQ